MLNVICVNHGNYLGRGDEYVARLQYGVLRSLRSEPRFHVLTAADVPPEVSGWWAKLAVFQPGRFDGRCMYIDLDTIVTGSLDDLTSYEGDFATLSDFYHSGRLASGVMLWEAGKADRIWENWKEVGFPQFHPGGDGSWIEVMMPRADRIQALFPGQVASFKAHCGAGVPSDARLVCFHGNPRPHDMKKLMEMW